MYDKDPIKPEWDGYIYNRAVQVYTRLYKKQGTYVFYLWVWQPRINDGTIAPWTKVGPKGRPAKSGF